jgi:hypothetical protein
VSKARKRTASLLSVALAFGVLSVGSSASSASKTVVDPTLTLQAYTVGGRQVVAQGVYDNVSSNCQGPGGRPVAVYFNSKFRNGDRTDSSGFYYTKTGPLKKRRYRVQSFAPGQVKGGYAQTTICHDAWSNVVRVRV